MRVARRRRCAPSCSPSPTVARCASTWWTPITEKDAAERTQVRVGRLTKAHGLKGAIKVELYTDDPAKRFVPGAVFRLQVPTGSRWHGKLLELLELKWYNTHPVAFFKDVPDRDTAESLVKAILWVDQDPSETTGDDDAWYDHQLVGLKVMRDGVMVGRVSRVDHLPSQDLLVVDTDGGEVLVPFVSAIVPTVDVAGGTVTVTPPLGLFEEIEDEPVEVDTVQEPLEAEPAVQEPAVQEPAEEPAAVDPAVQEQPAAASDRATPERADPRDPTD